MLEVFVNYVATLYKKFCSSKLISFLYVIGRYTSRRNIITRCSDLLWMPWKNGYQSNVSKVSMREFMVLYMVLLYKVKFFGGLNECGYKQIVVQFKKLIKNWLKIKIIFKFVNY